MSRIVVLVGSNRKGGNTDLLARAFADGVGDRHEVELLSVADYKVGPCIGCNSCFQREGNPCFQQDDMQQIYDKLKTADILVIASPVYFYGLSAQLKAVIIAADWQIAVRAWLAERKLKKIASAIGNREQHETWQLLRKFCAGYHDKWKARQQEIAENFQCDKEVCTSCGLCERICPKGNILRPQGQPIWQ